MTANLLSYRKANSLRLTQVFALTLLYGPACNQRPSQRGAMHWGLKWATGPQKVWAGDVTPRGRRTPGFRLGSPTHFILNYMLKYKRHTFCSALCFAAWFCDTTFKLLRFCLRRNRGVREAPSFPNRIRLFQYRLLSRPHGRLRMRHFLFCRFSLPPQQPRFSKANFM